LPMDVLGDRIHDWVKQQKASAASAGKTTVAK